MQLQQKTSALTVILATACGVVLGALLLYGTISYYGLDLAPTSSAWVERFPVITRTPPTQEMRVIAAIEKVQPAVVTIVITKDLPKYVASPGLDPFFNGFFSDPPQNNPTPPQTEKTRIGGGSGFFVSADGMIVTNRHVVSDEEADYTVVTSDGKKYPAKILARDAILDLAILKVEGKDFRFLTFGDSDKLKLGQTVLAIGNALDEFRNTVTSGIVSGLNRRLTAGDNGGAELIESAIQTDAAINPGNSGGPLVDVNGQVIGINTAMALDGQSVGFALPSNSIKRDVEQVQQSGKIIRPFLGVRYQLVNDELISKNQLKVTHGAIVTRGQDASELAVLPGSPADKAGLKENDIILQVDGVDINEEHSLSALIARRMPGDKIQIKISRGGEEQVLTATLEEIKK
ncbi:MAG: trypsin-like peptidase domain-containing protein [Patescibacteria group bacterium]|nr:trypsin-like peptidase domain-containing protein [Patescibacteria group bacterium]